uniref:Uncharacterized protein n=1 Tax=Cacopsylla melanoneura TaxID=428564 RepID=A0A8D8VSS1_9HEMI
MMLQIAWVALEVQNPTEVSIERLDVVVRSEGLFPNGQHITANIYQPEFFDVKKEAPEIIFEICIAYFIFFYYLKTLIHSLWGRRGRDFNFKKLCFLLIKGSSRWFGPTALFLSDLY